MEVLTACDISSAGLHRDDCTIGFDAVDTKVPRNKSKWLTSGSVCGKIKVSSINNIDGGCSGRQLWPLPLLIVGLDTQDSGGCCGIHDPAHLKS